MDDCVAVECFSFLKAFASGDSEEKDERGGGGRKSFFSYSLKYRMEE